MTIEIIQDDIFNFIDTFFKESLDVIDTNFDFIDTHQLLEPKENYFFVLKFLNTTMQHFTNLDYSFSSDTLKKIHRDTNNLKKLYDTNQEYLEDLNTLFEKKFLKKVPLFLEMQEEVKQIKKNSPLDDYDKESIEIIKKHYTEMKAIYREHFETECSNQLNEILDSLKNIVNSKTFYFDRLLWIDANRSDLITRVLKNMNKNEKISSKIYISHRLSIDLPYTDEYKYLEKCLRIYK